ncbi:MAG: hypothetical protein IJN90_07910 [Bacilli bacterium]|nr:hypothetical protein [Bacilli bacterium]
MKFLNKLQQFMYGRSGLDSLGIFLFKLYLVLLVINIFMKSNVILIVTLVLIIIILYRMLSKNIYKRSDENVKFLKIKKKFLKPFSNIKRKINDKNHIYKKCRYCKTILKLPLPNKRGFKKVKCPECKKRNKFLILREEKIELIRNNKSK